MSDIPPAKLLHSLSPLPEPELLVDILSRLPVKSLLQFRAVSKPWRTLIDSQYFINKHLNNSIKTNTNINIVFHRGKNLYAVPFDSLTQVRPVYNPIFRDYYDVVGSCNGVLCLYERVIVEMVLFNPSTRKFKEIPTFHVTFPIGASSKLYIDSFGYDCVNDDYKVVRIKQFFDDGLESVVWVYSLKSGFWYGIGRFPYYLCYQCPYSVFVNGCLHWVVKIGEGLEKDIVAFDLGTEEYRVVPQPEPLYRNFFQMSLGVMSGCLCVLYNHDSGLDIWIMKSYGVKESWHNLISIPSAKKSRYSRSNLVRLLAYSESDGKVLMEEEREGLFWYDLKTKSVMEARLADLTPALHTDVYYESLTQLNSGGAGGSGKREVVVVEEEDKEEEEECKGDVSFKEAQVGSLS